MHKQCVGKLLHTDLQTMKSRLAPTSDCCLLLLPACFDTKDEIAVHPKHC
jgi:hypothetical protein